MQNFIQKISRLAIKNTKIFCWWMAILAFFMWVIPHFYFLHRIQQLKNEVVVLKNKIEKNPKPKDPNVFTKTLDDAALKQKWLSNLFSSMANSQIQWKRVIDQKDKLILVGESPEFLQLEHFLFDTKKSHLRFIIQKIEMMSTLHFELIMDKKNG